jgi:hypothetical protein
MDAEFLKQHVGSALAKGLAQVVVDRPEDAIDHLGKFLIKYADKQEREVANVQKKANMAKILAEKDADRAAVAAVVAEKTAAADSQAEADMALLAELRSAQNSAGFANADDGVKVQAAIDSLLGRCVEHLKARVGASAVYFGRLTTYPEGHEKAGAEYVAYDRADASNAFMAGKSLDKVEEEGEDRPPASGVTFEVFQPVEEEEAEEEELEEGQEPAPKPPKMPRHLHVDNVLRNNQVKFFKFPLLGAYLACDVASASSFHDGALNDEYLTASPEPEPVEGEEGEEAAAAEEDPAAEEKKDEEKTEGEDEPAPKKKRVWEPTEVKEGHLVIAADTMGQNRPFTDSEISFVHQLSLAMTEFIANVSKHQFQQEVWLRREHHEANAALGETLAADAESNEAAVADAGSKLGEEAAEEDKAAAEKEALAQIAKTAAKGVKDHVDRVLRMQLTPGAGVCDAIAAVAGMCGVAAASCNDSATGKPSWTLVSKLDTGAIFDAIDAWNGESFDAAAVESQRAVMEGVDADGAAAFSAAVGSLVNAAKAALDWSEACTAAKAAAAERDAAAAAAAAEGGDDAAEDE